MRHLAPHHAKASGFHDHLERARIEEVADEDRCGVAELRVRGLSAAAQARFVHDIVVKQRGGVDEFDDGREIVARFRFLPEGLATLWEIGVVGTTLISHTLPDNLDKLS